MYIQTLNQHGTTSAAVYTSLPGYDKTMKKCTRYMILPRVYHSQPPGVVYQEQIRGVAALPC